MSPDKQEQQQDSSDDKRLATAGGRTAQPKNDGRASDQQEQCAGREKDLDFARSAAQLGLLQREELLHRLQDVPCSQEDHRLIEARIKALFT
jgi:hypothetical protein